MRSQPRLTAALLAVSLALCGAPSRGAADTDVETLGIVVASHSATLGSGVASDGATLYNGDRLVTAPNGGLSLRSGDAMLYMSGSTQVTLHRSQSHNPAIKKSLIRANVTSGSVSFSLSPDEYFLVSANGALIGPAAPMPTLGEITILDRRLFEIRALRGPLKIVYYDDSEIIAEGKAYRVELAAPDAAKRDAAPNQNASTPKWPPPLDFFVPARRRRCRSHRHGRRLRSIRGKPRLSPTQSMQPSQLTQLRRSHLRKVFPCTGAALLRPNSARSDGTHTPVLLKR